MRLTPHFTLEEFTVTNTGLDNSPSTIHLERLKMLAVCMEQARAILGGHPLFLTSVYRNKKVNARVGGVPNSDHAEAYAADFRSMAMTAYKAAKILVASPLAFDQLILERGNTLIHLSFNPLLRREILRQPGGPGSPFYSGLD